jgi:putative membrane protein
VNRNDHPADTTELAEDRTLLANERTFAGWMRTSLGCVGVAIAFNALFGEVSPIWVPRAIATLFLLLSILIAWSAQRRAAAVRRRLSAHVAEAQAPVNLAVIAAAISLGAVALALAFWMLPLA